MKVQTCPYCMQGELLTKFGYLAFETEVSSVIVFKDQSHLGRLIVAYKNDHVSEIQYLSDEERKKFMDDVNNIAKAIQKGFNPDRINYAAFGDTLGHLHFHLVPKYKDEFEWGGMFTMNTGNLVDEAKCEEISKIIKINFESK